MRGSCRFRINIVVEKKIAQKFLCDIFNKLFLLFALLFVGVLIFAKLGRFRLLKIRRPASFMKFQTIESHIYYRYMKLIKAFQFK